MYSDLGIDLQKEMHEDMKKHFNAYRQDPRSSQRSGATTNTPLTTEDRKGTEESKPNAQKG